MNDLKKTLILSFVAILSFGFIGCSQDAEEPHVHTFATEWTNNETHHWHGTTCGHDEKGILMNIMLPKNQARMLQVTGMYVMYVMGHLN